MNRFVVLAIISVLADFPFLQAAVAETWPDQPIHIVVPFTPGSATDVVARAVAAVMTKNLGQTVIVDNKPGAGGTIGAAQVARAAPDGYTLLANSSAHTVNPAIYPNMTFDTAKDLPGVTLLAVQPNIMVASPEKGWKTAADYVKAAKAQPGKLTYASAGTGSGTHMNAEKFKLAADIDTVHIPYKGTPEALKDTMTGRITYFFSPISAALPQIRDGKLIALAVSSAKRSSALPDVPTIAESGLPAFDYNLWVALFGPASLPADLVTKINADVQKIVALPDIRERLAGLGAEPMPMSAPEFRKFVRDEIQVSEKIVKSAGIVAQ